jgi:hypothetical protein
MTPSRRGRNADQHDYHNNMLHETAWDILAQLVSGDSTIGFGI